MTDTSEYAPLTQHGELEKGYYDEEQSFDAPQVSKHSSCTPITKLQTTLFILLAAANVICLVIISRRINAVAQLLQSHVDLTTSTRELPRPDPYYELH